MAYLVGLDTQFAVQIALVLGVALLGHLMLVRPQLRRIDEHARFVASLKPGDRVVVGHGLVGVVAALENAELVQVDLSSTTRVTVMKNSVERRLPTVECPTEFTRREMANAVN